MWRRLGPLKYVLLSVWICSEPRIYTAGSRTSVSKRSNAENWIPRCVHGTQQVAHNLVVSSMCTWHTDRCHTYSHALSLTFHCRFQWPRGLRCRSAAARLLGLRVRIPPVAWTSVVSVVCCQVEVSAMSWSLVQRSPTDCGASGRDLEISRT